MPEPRQHDNDPQQWRRELERERLSRLSISEGEGLPGPGAVAASAIHPTPPMEGGEPEDWSRQLERDRLSMQAVTGETEYPGPGAMGGLAGEIMDDLKPPDRLAAVKDPMAAAQAMKDALAELKKNWPILETRSRLWQAGYMTYGVLMPAVLLILPFHKIMYDARVKDTAIKLKTAVRKTGIPLPPQAELIIKISPWLPSIEWLLWLAMVSAMGAIILLVLVMIGFLGCAFSFPGECGRALAWEMGSSAVRLFKAIVF